MSTDKIIYKGCPHLLRPVVLTGLVAVLVVLCPWPWLQSAGAEVATSVGNGCNRRVDCVDHSYLDCYPGVLPACQCQYPAVEASTQWKYGEESFKGLFGGIVDSSSIYGKCCRWADKIGIAR